MAFRSPAAAVPAAIVTFSFPRPLIPEDAYAVATAVAVPVSVVTDDASITPVVLPSRKLRVVAVATVSDRVTASSPLPLKPGVE